MKIESYLRLFTWGPFECYLEFLEGDRRFDLDASACLYYALVNGTDVSDYLDPDVVKQIEGDACSRFLGS